MYKKFYLKSLLLLLALIVGNGSVWADATYSMTPDQTTTGSSSTSYITTLTEFTHNGVSWKMNQWNPSTLQIKTNQSSAASEFRFYNTSAFSGRITSVVITFSDLTVSDASKLMFLGGTSEVTATTGGTAGTWNETDKTLTWTPGTSDDFTYFAFYQNGKAATGTNKLATADAIVVTYDETSSSKTATTVTINDTNLTNTDVYAGTSAGTLIASVTETSGGAAVSGASVTWASSNTDVASVDNNGAVTLVASGTTTITASYAGDDTYASSSATYELSVTDSTPNTDTWVLADLADLTESDVFVIVGYNGKTYAMSNDKGTGTAPAAVAVTISNDMIASTVEDNIKWNISGNATDGYVFYPAGSTTTWLYTTTSNNGLRVGSSANKYIKLDETTQYLTIYDGNSTRYIGIYASSDWRSYTTIGSNIKSQSFSFYKKDNGGVTPPYISADNVNIAYDATSGSISYTVNNPVDGGVVTAATTSSWLTVGTVGDEAVPFTASANDGLEREATVTLTYTYGNNETVTKDVTVTQAANPNAAGTANNPYTVAQARAAIDANTGITDVYVTGIVTRNTYFSESAGTITYFISDDGTETNELEVYSGKGIDGAKFTAQDDIQAGDVVVVRGNLTLYNNTTYEFASGNQLVSLERNEIEYYLTGTFNSWSSTLSEMQKLEKNNEGKYSTTMTISENTEFKIRRKNLDGSLTWIGAQAEGSYYLVLSDGDIQMNENGGQNVKFETAGEYSFTFDDSTYKLNVTGFPVPEVKYYLAGDWTQEWGDGKIELTENADGTFSTSKQVGNGTRFKFVKTVDGAETWYGATQSGDDYGINSGWCTNIGLSDAGNSSAFVIQMASDNELVFKLNPTNMTFNVTGWPISIEGNMFVKVTSDADFTDGAYLIVNETAGVAFNGGLETLDVANNIISVTIDNGKIEATDANKAALFTIVNGGKITSASGHYIGVSDYSNSLKVDGNATMYENSVSIENGNADIAIYTGTSGYVHLKYNKASDQNRFRYYKSGQQPIQLYKLVTLPMNDIVITSAKWATYVPNLAVTIPEDVTAYIVTNATSTSVTLSSVASAPANTGLVVNGDEGTYTPTAAETTDDVSGNLLVVSDGTVVGNGNIYALGNKNGSVGFKKVKSGVTVPAGKPYLTIESSGSKDFFDFSFDEGVATGIESVESIGFDMNAPVYDLQGRQVNRLHKGVFIQNGKKIIVK